MKSKALTKSTIAYDFDIVVVGGGMVGACTAALLAADPELSRFRVAMLEASPAVLPDDTEIDLRVSAISRASERILSAIGAWQLFPAAFLSPYSEMIVWDESARPRGPGSIHFSASESSEPNLGHIVENRRIQHAIYEVPSFRRVTHLRTSLQSMQFESERVELGLSDGRKLSCGLVIGADGVESLSRKLAGIETVGRRYDQSAFVTHVRTEHPHQQTAWQRFLKEGPIAFLPLADGRSSIVWTTRPEHATELVTADPREVAQQIERAIDGIFGNLVIAGPRGQFPLRWAHADSYCANRFALVGDAAHAVHPLAGQGVNLGFLDAAALVQVLSEGLTDAIGNDVLGEHRLLRRYERWRKTENAVALGLIDGLNRLFSNSDPVRRWLRSAGLTSIDRAQLLKHLLMSRAMGTAGELPIIARRAPSL
ncbi:MAG TPA: UbiH/UbiF/VisC/COQ6 family ubiquinone biosynthesis hydroxylase [Steroidobacteraceae bacterium]|nr:UbiH/UbiF/VisC/COQ6 family ubiquinone biosynthesis hydroxylase [Steroidobacteraceae bacterium]